MNGYIGKPVPHTQTTLGVLLLNQMAQKKEKAVRRYQLMYRRSNKTFARRRLLVNRLRNLYRLLCLGSGRTIISRATISRAETPTPAFPSAHPAAGTIGVQRKLSRAVDSSRGRSSTRHGTCVIGRFCPPHLGV